MPAAPSESPIAISSTSPTPERPGLRPSRSTSSSSFAPTAGPSTRRSHAPPARASVEDDDVFSADLDTDIDAHGDGDRPIQPRPRRAVDPRRRQRPFALAPTARPFRPRVEHGLAIPSRTSSPASSNATAGTGRGTVIDLTEDDDDVEITGVNVADLDPPPRARARVGMQNGPIWRDLRRIDEVAAERERAVRGILNDPDLQRRRQVLSPPPVPAGQANRPRNVRFDPLAWRRNMDDIEGGPQPPPPPPAGAPPPPPPAPEQRRPIRLGGAVLRQGDRQINYNQPQRAAARNALPPMPDFGPGRPQARAPQGRAELEAQINARIQRRIRERDNGGYAGIADMLNGVMDNWGIAHGLEAALGDPAAFAQRIRQMGIDFPWRRGAGAGAGPAGMANQRPLDDPQTIIAQVPKFDYPPLPDGFTSNFEIDSTIEIDQPASSKRYLACVDCAEPLLLSSGYKTPDDRVWALRCGHLIDQKCLVKISQPQSEDDRANINRPPPGGLSILGEDETPASNGRGGRKAKKPRPNARKTAPKPVEYEWTCPAKDCGHPHKSELKDLEWTQVDQEGALQLYA